jgi:hypothetical protein
VHDPEADARRRSFPPSLYGKTNAETAKLLYEYMSFRAGREHQEHELTPAYYQKYLDAGVRTFFGIEVGSEGLAADRQQPLLFEEWKNRRVQ